MTPRRILFLGPPGAGKGTQASRLAGELGVPQVATGDMFRKAVTDGTELGRQAKRFLDAGELVPDEVTISMLAERISQPDAQAGFLLDGFPRNLAQAKALERELDGALDLVVHLVVPEHELVRRLSGRRSCPNGHVYHIEEDPPAEDGICDEDGEMLFQREDDREEVVRNRLRVYGQQTEPLIGFYGERGLVREVDGLGDPDEVEKRILETVRGSS